MLERERIVEIVVAVAAVLTMIAAMLWIGATYGDENGLTGEGTDMLVWTIVGFIFLLTVIGVGLAYALNPPEESTADDADADAAT